MVAAAAGGAAVRRTASAGLAASAFPLFMDEDLAAALWASFGEIFSFKHFAAAGAFIYVHYLGTFHFTRYCSKFFIKPLYFFKICNKLITRNNSACKII